MMDLLRDAAARVRVIFSRLLARIGGREDSFLLVLAVFVGVITAAAAVGFHELIVFVRNELFKGVGERVLYSGWGLALLVVIPGAGGLIVGLLGKALRAREGHGVVDVMESVIRSSGFEKPRVAFEKILTSGVTIGTGGSAGAEGPIVQIGAAVASGVGQTFRLARHQMPVLIGCGCAAGISAIFNAPIGGLLFALEVILLDFSIRTITPLIVASVIANVTTRAIFAKFVVGENGGATYTAIFNTGRINIGGGGNPTDPLLTIGQVGNFILLGLICGMIALGLIRAMQASEAWFGRFRRLGVWRPAIGGAAVGLVGVLFVLAGQVLLKTDKPVPFADYPMPAFFGDGYGVIEKLLAPEYYGHRSASALVLLLGAMCAAKVLCTCLTLSSGGSGGVIAPCLFLGATAGGLLGVMLRETGLFGPVQPEVFALVGMGAVLAAVVHAPLAAILILFELTADYRVILAAMLASISAIGVARLIYRDSIYTAGLRHRGIRFGAASDLSQLRRLNVEQVALEPASVVQPSDPLQRVLDLMEQLGAASFVVIDDKGLYSGMVVNDDINDALMHREAIPLMLVGEIMRPEVPTVNSEDDLGSVFDLMNHLELSHLPVVLSGAPGKVIGMISRAGLMRKYQSLSD